MAPKQQNKKSDLLVFRKNYILVGMEVALEHFPVRLGLRRKYTLNETPAHYRDTLRH